MKRVISVLLSVFLVFSVVTPVASAVGEENLPIIYIRGNGEIIYDGDDDYTDNRKDKT